MKKVISKFITPTSGMDGDKSMRTEERTEDETRKAIRFMLLSDY